MEVEYKILNDLSDCCGCFACMNVCPVRAIEKVKNKKGFWYPQIDGERCIQCNKCRKTCPVTIEDNRSRY